MADGRDVPGFAQKRCADAVFAGLEGAWLLERSIEGVGTMLGTVEFRRAADGVLEYSEQGVFKLDSGAEFNAFRTLYYYRESPGIVVRLRATTADEDVLHRLPIQTEGDGPWPSAAADTHLCGQDTYAGTYRFEAPDRVCIGISVTGPKKDAVIETVLSRRRRQ